MRTEQEIRDTLAGLYSRLYRNALLGIKDDDDKMLRWSSAVLEWVLDSKEEAALSK